MRNLRSVIIVILWLGALFHSSVAQEGAGTLVRSQGVVKVQQTTFRGPSFHPQRDSVAPDGVLSGTSLGRSFDTQFLPWALATSGQTLALGTTLETGEDGSATVALSRGGELYLYPSTRVLLPNQAGGRLKLLSGKAWIKSDSRVDVLTSDGPLSLGSQDEVIVADETDGISLAVLSGELTTSGVSVEGGQMVRLSDLDANPSPVEAQVERPKSRIGVDTSRQSYLLPPFYANPKDLEEARQLGMDGQLAEKIKVWLDEGRLLEASQAMGELEAGEEKSLLETRLALLGGDFAKASQAHLVGDSPHSRFHAGLLAWSDYRLTEAEQHFELAKPVGEAYCQAAQAYLVEFQRGHFRQAEALLLKALAYRPATAAWHRQLGDIYASLARNGSALDFYRKAQELDSGQAFQTSLRVANLLTKMGRRKEALAALEDYREGALEPEADVHYALAAAFTALNQGKLKRAWELSELAVETSSAIDPALRYLALDLQGLILARRRQYGAAVEKYRNAGKLSPGDPFLLNDLALAVSRSGDLYQALEHLLEAKKRAPESPTIRANLGIVYNLLGQPQRAQSELQQALRLAPDNGRVLQELGLVLDNNGLEATGDRIIVQASILDPQVIAPKPQQAFLSVQTDPFLDPRFGLGYSANVDGVAIGAFSVGEEEEEALLGDNSQENFLTIGTHLSERDRIWVKVGAETQRESVTDLGIGGFERQGVAEVGYYRELSPKTSMWALAGHGQAQEKFTPALRDRDEDGVENSQGHSSTFELRFDHQVSPNNVLRGGYAYLDEFEYNTESAGPRLPENTENVKFRFNRIWFQDEWSVRPDLHLVGGLHYDKLSTNIRQREFGSGPFSVQGTSDRVNPYFGLVYQPGPQTELSLGAVRESDIAFLAHDEERFHQLAPTLLNNTTQFPLRVNELNRVEQNSLTGELLPVWDYRLQLRHGIGKHAFLTAEGYHTEVLPSDIQNPALDADFDTDEFPDLDLGQLLLQERSRLRGVRADLEFWDGGKTVGTLGYRFRDYRFRSAPFRGNRWRYTPKHEFEARILRQLYPGLTLELNPTWESEVFEDRANTRTLDSKAALSPFLHWQPTSELLVSLGYRDLLTTSRRAPDRRGWIVRLFSRF